MFDVYLTIEGKKILNKLLAGEKLTITRAVLSSQTTETPEELTVINPELLESTQLALTDHGTYTTIDSTFDLSTLESSLNFRCVGIYGQSSNSNETLIYVAIVGVENQIVIPAHSPINYIISIKETLTTGLLQVISSPSYATPLSHNSDYTRHIFSQTNDSTTLALVNSGVEETFLDNDSIVFIPKVNMNSGATLRIAGTDYTLAFQDIDGNGITDTFIAHKPYGMAFDSTNNAFVYKSYDKIEIVSGIPHYWDGIKWCSTKIAGEIICVDLTSAPTGYLNCDGSSVDKNDYPELFEAIGYRHGGSGDNFNLPDLRGRFILGSKTGSHAIGSTGGSETKTLNIGHMPKHKHDVTTSNKDTDTTYNLSRSEIGISLPNPNGYPNYEFTLSANPQTQTSITISESYKGSGNAFNIMNPYLTLNYFISTGKSLL